VNAVKRAVAWIKKEHPQTEVITGCSEGIQELAITCAGDEGLRTVGMVPWKGYNAHIQKRCDKALCIYDLEAELQVAAQDSVGLYHPNPPTDQEEFYFHALSYVILKGADLLIAFPPCNCDGGDPTTQAVRIAQAFGTTTWCVDQEGNKVDPAKFRPVVEEVSVKPGALTFICGQCSWSCEVPFGGDPTDDGACPECHCESVGIFDDEGEQVA